MSAPSKYNSGCASHLFRAFYHRQKHIEEAISDLKFNEVKFDTIVCTGISGVVFGSVLAYVMDKKLIIVRKVGDRSHSCLKVEGSAKRDEIGRWIFVDDLIDSGNTLRRVKRAMRKHTGDTEDKNYVGDYLYDTERFEAAEKNS